MNKLNTVKKFLKKRKVTDKNKIVLLITLLVLITTSVITKRVTSSLEKSPKETSVNAQVLTKKDNNSWYEYINYTYGFSFRFPNTWDAYLDNNNMSIKTRLCDGCGGTTNQIAINYLERTKIHDIDPTHERYLHLDNKLIIYVNREVPTAGTNAQEAYIYTPDNKHALKVFCGECDTEIMNAILSTFEFTN